VVTLVLEVILAAVAFLSLFLDCPYAFGDAVFKFLVAVERRGRFGDLARVLARQADHSKWRTSDLGQKLPDASLFPDLRAFATSIDPDWEFVTPLLLCRRDQTIPSPFLHTLRSRRMNRELQAAVENLRRIKERIDEELSVLESYADQSNAELPQKALAILKRHNLPWGRRHLLSPCRVPGYVKSVTNPRAQEIAAAALGAEPSLYRLAYVKQLSTVCYSQKLDAAHSRLPHALGMAEVAAMLLESIERPLSGSHVPGRTTVEEWERVAVIVYALIHDAYHGPMGHSLELMGSLLRIGDLVRLDKDFLKANLTSGGDLADLLEAVARATGQENKIVEIKDLVDFFLQPDADRHSDKLHRKHYLNEIVNSEVDADRIDYLLRDGLHLGEPIVDKNSWIDALMSARVMVTPSEKGVGAQSKNQIAFPLCFKSRIEHILSLRHRFYKEYYEAPDKLILDDMICHVFYYYLDLLQAFTTDRKDAPRPSLHRQILNEFMKLTDDNVFSFLVELELAAGKSRLWYPRDLMNDVLTNRHYKFVCGIAYKESELADIRRKAGDFLRAIRSDETIGKRSPQRLAKVIQARFTDRPLDEDVISCLFAYLNHDSFPDKLTHERNLWTRIRTRPEIESSWSRVLEQNYGPYADEIKEQFNDYPPLHLTLPTDPESQYYVHYIRDRSLGYLPAQPQPPEILFYDESGKAVKMEPDISYAVRTFKPYFIIISVHCDLFRESQRNEQLGERFPDIVREAFLKDISDPKWLVPKL
jgi:HD superfamily phosphohydrolase